MKNRITLLIVAIAAASLFSACTATVGTGASNANANAKPANANTAAPANTASNTASSNTNSADKDTAGNPDLDFTLVNGTGYDIKTVLVGPTGDKNWTKDDELDLKGKEFKDKDSMTIKFHPKEKAEKWDLRVEWSDGDAPVEWLSLDLTKIEKITLKYDKASGKTTAVTE
ncbi:MAG: hypothetical protein ACJ73D_08675 [Pyrinomonadaceae bacterium]